MYLRANVFSSSVSIGMNGFSSLAKPVGLQE
jgi:hypothetical protein